MWIYRTRCIWWWKVEQPCAKNNDCDNMSLRSFSFSVYSRVFRTPNKKTNRTVHQPTHSLPHTYTWKFLGIPHIPGNFPLHRHSRRQRQRVRSPAKYSRNRARYETCVCVWVCVQLTSRHPAETQRGPQSTHSELVRLERQQVCMGYILLSMHSDTK